MKTKAARRLCTWHGAWPNLLEVVLEILVIDRKVVKPPVKLSQMVCVWAKLLMDCVWTNP